MPYDYEPEFLVDSGVTKSSLLCSLGSESHPPLEMWPWGKSPKIQKMSHFLSHT